MNTTFPFPNNTELYGTDIRIGVEKLTVSHLPLLESFTCGNEVIDDFFKTQAADSIREVTYLFIYLNHNRIAAAASLSCSSIPLTSFGSYVESVPAVEITYFAVDTRYQKLHMEPDPAAGYFSDSILSHIIGMIYDFTEKFCGASHVLLYSTAAACHFYERNQFREINEDYYMIRQSHFLEGRG